MSRAGTQPRELAHLSLDRQRQRDPPLPVIDNAAKLSNGASVNQDVRPTIEAVRLRWRWRIRQPLWKARRFVNRYVGTDGLTGFGTFGQGLRLLKRDLAKGRAGAVIFCDLDNMAAFNHANGHALGDELLRLVAAVLKSRADAWGASRPWGCYRFGGDKFLIRLPGVSAESALELAEDARLKIKRLPVVLEAAEYEHAGEGQPFGARFAVSGWGKAKAPEHMSLLRALDEAICGPARDMVTEVVAPEPGERLA